MECLCSDTNIWLDFFHAEKLHLPFALPLTYLMYKESVTEELIYPAGLSEQLLSLGLCPVSMDMFEFQLAENIVRSYRRLSLHDAAALSIAKQRGILLLTGDKRLRKAAGDYGVRVMGSLGIIDRLMETKRVMVSEISECLYAFMRENHGKIRLPDEELQKRIAIIESL